MAKEFYKKILLIIVGTLLGLVILEAGLQIAGFTLTTLKKHRNKITKDPNTITILCLGESTTYKQWPPILQKILDNKSKNKKFNVIDEGIPGTNTKIIAEKISDNLIKYNPDVVITMMGINDSGLGYKNYKIKTLYLISLIKEHLKNRFSKYVLDEDIFYIDNKISELIVNNDVNAEKYLYKINEIYKKTNYNFIAFGNFIKYFIIYAQTNEYKNKKIIDIIDYHIINKQIITPWELQEIVFYLKDYKHYNKNQIMNFLISNKNRILYEEVILEHILMEYDLLYLLNDIKSNKFKFNYKNIKKSKNLNKDNTKKNYKYIISEIYKNKKNSFTLPMQYPTLSVEKLKQALKDNPYYNKLVFVSNEENFKQALKTHKTEEIFRDMFGGSFGHCTELGNTLIAENVAETILKLYNN